MRKGARANSAVKESQENDRSPPAPQSAPPPDTQAVLAEALVHYQAGRGDAAGEACRRILAAAPRQADALHLLGVLAFNQGQLDEAARCIDQALQSESGRADFWKNRSCVHRLQGDLGQAQSCMRQALALKPGDADAHAQLGGLLRAQGLHEEAEAAYREALRLTPASANWENDLGLVFLDAKRFDDAQACFSRALKLNQEFPEAHYNLGIALRALGRTAEAEASYLRALVWRPDYPDALNNLGNLLWDTGRLDEARGFMRRSVALKPDDAMMLANYGGLLGDLGAVDEAEEVLKRAVAAAPGQFGAHFRLGLMQQGRKRLDDAEAHYRQVLAESPGHVEALNNLGLVLMASPQRLAEAEACFQKLLAMAPHHQPTRVNLGAVLESMGRFEEAEQCLGHESLRDGEDGALMPEAGYNLGLVNLRQGRLTEGWSGYENRIRTKMFKGAFIDVPFPAWKGEPLEGRRMLLVGEQGRGDQIQFIRYARLLRERGAEVDAFVLPDVADLLATTPGLGRVHSGVAELARDAYDFSCFLLSAPRVVGTELATIPAEVPYLKANAAAVAHWGHRIDAAAAGRFKVGLAWAGNPEHQNDRLRSMKLQQLAPLFALGGIAWFSLQKGPAEAELADAAFSGTGIHALGPDLKSFSDTAAVVENLDLLISVDTAVVHLAGALARPVWVMLPGNPDWRWMLEREDSPWYPTMRLFRQSQLGDWAPVVERARQALEKKMEQVAWAV